MPPDIVGKLVIADAQSLSVNRHRATHSHAGVKLLGLMA